MMLLLIEWMKWLKWMKLLKLLKWLKLLEKIEWLIMWKWKSKVRERVEEVAWVMERLKAAVNGATKFAIYYDEVR